MVVDRFGHFKHAQIKHRCFVVFRETLSVLFLVVTGADGIG